MLKRYQFLPILISYIKESVLFSPLHPWQSSKLTNRTCLGRYIERYIQNQNVLIPSEVTNFIVFYKKKHVYTTVASRGVLY